MAAHGQERPSSGGVPGSGRSNPPEVDPKVELALGADAAAEFAAIPSQEEEDAHLEVLVARAQSSSGREHLSSLSALSQQMSAYPQLQPEEQADRIATYRRGVQAANKLATGRLKGHTLRAAERAVREGESAQIQLVGTMYRLALLICRDLAATRYGRERMLVMLPDLVSEANIAVVEAIQKYDERRVPRFSLYAGRVIRDRVRAVIQKADTVGVQSSWLRIKRLYVALRPELEMKLGRHPTEAEMQEVLREACLRWARPRLKPHERDLPEDQQMARMIDKLVKQGMWGGIERLNELLDTTQQTVASLDAPVGSDGDGARLGDLIPEQDADSGFGGVEHDELRRDLMTALNSLNERERLIMLHKYGFVDGETWTYAKLAPKFGVTAERVRQIDRAVLNKLRGPGFGHLHTHLPSHEP